jgi:hypothetical protein
MKLVDYSDSEGSDAENEKSQDSTPIPHSPPPAPKPHHAELPKRPPAKRQIIVDLPKPSRAAEEPKPKRMRTEGSGGSGLFSVLPPPKRTKPASNGTNGDANGTREDTSNDGPAVEEPASPKAMSELTSSGSPAEPTPAPALVRAFMPRSAQAKKGKPVVKPAEEKATSPAISLFPLGAELLSKPSSTETSSNPSTYEPLITQPITTSDADGLQEEEEEEDVFAADTTVPTSAPSSSTLSTSDLDSFAAHILEGRHRKNRTIQIMEYNAGEVYAQNAADKASGALEEQIAPVRAIGTGRHQITQLLNNVQDQKESLEEQFAKHRRIKKESAAKYGW